MADEPHLPWKLVKDGVVIAAFSERDLALDIRNALLEHDIKAVLQGPLQIIVEPELN